MLGVSAPGTVHPRDPCAGSISQAGARGLSVPLGRDPHRSFHLFPRSPGPGLSVRLLPRRSPGPPLRIWAGSAGPATPAGPSGPGPARPRPIPSPLHGAPRASLTPRRSPSAPGDGPRRGAATGPPGCPSPAGPSGAGRDPPVPRATPGTSPGLPRPDSSDTRRDPPAQPIAGADPPAPSETLPRGKGSPRARGSLPGPREPAPLGTHQLSPPGPRTPGAPQEGPGPPARIPAPGLAPDRSGSRFQGWGQPGCPGPPG